MYLLKSANGLYFSRVRTPKNLVKQGYPFDVKVSLMTKDRRVCDTTKLRYSFLYQTSLLCQRNFTPYPL